ncbi:MAG: PHP-associated domain-containing protein [Candidatus Nanoarchaeia archaeon]
MIDKVVFKKPRVINTKEFSYADMHYHTRYSDGITRVVKVMKKCRKKGIGIAITDHNDVRGSILASRYRNVMVIPGMEIGVKEGAHILLYFYKTKDMEEFYLKHVKDNRPKDPMRNLKLGIQEIIDLAKKYNAVTCAPHPYQKMARTSICKAIKQKRISPHVMNHIQLIEVINGLNLKMYDVKAAVLANKLSKGITGGSDGHTTREIGKVLTYTNRVGSKEEFLEELVKKRSYVIGKQLNIAARIMPHTVSIKSHMKHPIYWIKEGKKILKEKNNKLKEKLRKV